MTTPTANWNVTTIDGVEYLVINTAQFRIPLDWDPSSNMFIAVAAPNAAVPIGTGGFPALVTGPAGPVTTISDIINFTSLPYSSLTPDSASFTPIGTNQVQLNLALHVGAPGTPGTFAVAFPSGSGATDVAGASSATPGQMLAVNTGATGFVFTSPYVGDRFIPATIAAVPSGNSLYTMATVTVPAQPFAWRPDVAGQTVLTATGSSVSVDLIARLSNTNPDGGVTTGNIVGRSFGTGVYPANQILVSGPPAGSASTYDHVPAGQIASVFFNVERQSGPNYCTTSATTTSFCVKVRPALS